MNNINIGYEIRDLCGTDVEALEDESHQWDILDSDSEDIRNRARIEDKIQPKIILLMNNSTQTFLLKAVYQVPFAHKYVVGSLKFWYSDADFSDGSTLTLELFVTPDNPPTIEDLVNPCFTMEIPSPEERIQSRFEYIYFGASHDSPYLYFIMKLNIRSDQSQFIKPKSLAFRDLTLHVSTELQDVTYPLVGCSLSQENLICQDCAERCETCFGPKPSQCLSCSAGNHWRGSECMSCHGFCRSCSGPTPDQCMGCNFGYYNYGNGTCSSDTCRWPFHETDSWPERKCERICKSDEYAWKEE